MPRILPSGRRGRAAAALAAALAVALPAAAAAPSGPERLPVLMYHRIDLLKAGLPPITRRLTVDPGDFAAQMEWLHAHGYTALTEGQVAQALAGGVLPRRPVVITLDDGYRDVLFKASPVLRRLHLHATAFIITDRVSAGDPSFLTWSELKALERAGVEIGSHTVTHGDLTRMTSADALRELRDARATLEAHLSHPVPWLAYPSGRYDAAVVALARQAGYRLAYTTRPGSAQDPARALELKRYEVLDTTGARGVAAFVSAG